jgi:hypothetical protein
LPQDFDQVNFMRRRDLLKPAFVAAMPFVLSSAGAQPDSVRDFTHIAIVGGAPAA